MSVHSKTRMESILNRRSLKKQQKKYLIIESAVKVFARKGFYHATVNEIAREAGIADGTMYTYFQGKDDLLISLFEEKMEDILDRFDEQLKEISDPVERLSKFIEVYFLLIDEDKNLAEVFQVELRQSTKFLKDYHNQKFLDYLDMIAAILQDGIDQGFFRTDINIEIIKIMIFGALDEVARQWILGADEKYSLEEAAQQITKSLINGFIIN